MLARYGLLKVLLYVVSRTGLEPVNSRSLPIAPLLSDRKLHMAMLLIFL